MIDQLVLNDTLQKINASLNKRFEKDANLYISKQDEFEIKKHLCNNALAAVVDMVKGKDISPEIVMKVLVRNAGIITVGSIHKFEKELKPILDNVKYTAVMYMMEDVLNNTVYVDKPLKHLLYKYYINGVSAKEKLKYWKSEDYLLDTHERTELFMAIIKDEKAFPASARFDKTWQFMMEAFRVYRYIMQDNRIILWIKDLLSEPDKKKLFKNLCDEMASPSFMDDLYEHMIIDAYMSYGKVAFDDAISNLMASARTYKAYVKVVATIILAEKNPSMASTLLETVVKVYESPYTKRHVKSRIEDKVWKAAKRNAALYEAKSVAIDRLTANTEKDSVSQYTSFSDVTCEFENKKRSKEIAYAWVNMKPDAFNQSLVDSFQDGSEYYEDELREAYQWLFKHSTGRARINGLIKMCNVMANAILQHGKIEGMAEVADDILLDIVLDNSIKGSGVKQYLSTFHFEEFKNKYTE